MIEEEDSQRPMTDEKITENLGKIAIRMPIRTGIKYRGQLQILDSNERKRKKESGKS